jgi:hypothetical protein
LRADKPITQHRVDRTAVRVAIVRTPDGRQLLQCAVARLLCDTKRSVTMKNPLDSIWGTIISGLILTAILYAAVRNLLT